MTLAQIIRLALRQLDEDPADAGDYRDLFVEYANQGYTIALRQYIKPLETMTVRTDGNGDISIDGMEIVRVESVLDGHGQFVYAILSTDGMVLHTFQKDADLTMVCEVKQPPLEEDTDEPRMPPESHMALVDYICYRHLSTGNLAKQSRAQYFRNEFYAQMQMACPKTTGGVTGFKHLYDVSGARWG